MPIHPVIHPGTSTDNEVPTFDGITGKLLQAGSGVFVVAGEVGIGAVPTEKFEVFGVNLSSVAVENASTISTASGAGLKLTNYYGTSPFYMAVDNAGIFQMEFGVSGYLSMDSGGQLTTYKIATTYAGALSAPSIALDLTSGDETGFYLPAVNIAGVIANRLEAARFGDAEVVINEFGRNTDFRIESSVDANTFFVDGLTGYAGIGTTTPAQKLDINGITTFGGSNGYIRHDSPGYFRFQAGSSGYEFRNNANNDTLMHIENGGDIGIGTATPAYLIDIEAEEQTLINLDESQTFSVFTAGSPTIRIRPTITDNNSGNNSPYTYFQIAPQVTHSVGVGATGALATITPSFTATAGHDVASNQTMLTIHPSYTGQRHVNSHGLYIDVTYSGITGNENFTALETVKGDVHLCSTSGNVGVGTATPGAKLDVQGTLSIGTGHTVTGTLASVAGGASNTASATNSFVGGGTANVASQTNSFVGGGSTNVSAALYGFIGAGRLNDIGGSAQESVVVGGYNNNITATGQKNAIVCGNTNTITGTAQYATVVNGYLNSSAADYSFIGGGQYGSIAAGSDHSVIAGGFNNGITGGDFHIIVGGQANVISATAQAATIVGGASCTTAGGYTFIGGGLSNTIVSSGLYNTIVGGQLNSILTGTSENSFIGGGESHTIDGSWSVIAGGYNNTLAGGGYSFIGAGQHNSNLGNNAFIGAGTSCSIAFDVANAVLVGGHTNSADANFSFLGGGQNCSIASGADHSVIVGGNNNDITSTGDDQVIGGGNSNQITGTAAQATICGGYNNNASALNSVIGGGANNIASAQSSVVGGGNTNSGAADYGFIGGGQNCSIAAGADHSVVVGGYNNDVTGTGDDNTIGGGNGNQISATTGIDNTIGGGKGNTISGGAVHYVTIGGGQLNTGSADRSTVAGGYNNTVSALNGFVGGGDGNTASAQSSVLVGGYLNSVAAVYGFIGGGQNCSIASGADHSVVVGGNNNDITATGHDNSIGGGQANVISGAFAGSAIAGGEGGSISASWAVISGGYYNTVTSKNGVIVGGQDSTVSGENGFIGSGRDNTNDANYGFLGGGQNCSIAAGAEHSVIVGGNDNDITSTGDDNAIGGGNANQITGTATSATITGGASNVASGDYSQAGGYQSDTRALRGAVVNANGQAAVVGDRQTRSAVMRRQTTTDTFLSLTADNAADSATDTFQMPEDSTARVKFSVIGALSTGAKTASYSLVCMVKRYSATTTLVFQTKTVEFEDDATWDIQAAVYSLGVTVQAKGGSGETVNWCATLESVEIV